MRPLARIVLQTLFLLVLPFTASALTIAHGTHNGTGGDDFANQRVAPVKEGSN